MIERTIACLGLILTGVLGPADALSQYSLQQAFPNLSFTNPVDLQNAGDGSDRLFVVEQAGVISVFQNDADVTSRTRFLNIKARVNDLGFEEGLLGLAFHPDYETNGYFYVDYTTCNPDRIVISRFQVTEDPNVADPESELVLLEILDPFENHNGGQLAFGPDGYLYISVGDGGNFGDQFCWAQDRSELSGKIHRIDVDNPSGGLNYGIPADNPFAGNTQGFREEIFAYGMRNPWRMSFDSETGWLWCADVGQDFWEEIDIIQNGGNYGWAIMEANHCYNSPWECAPDTCDQTGLISPIWEYSHDEGVAATGGYVYRGANLPSLVGKYIYTDWFSGHIWSLEYDGVNPTVNTELLTAVINSSAFGVDEANELYILGLDGMIYSIVEGVELATTDAAPNSLIGRTTLIGNSPNPFNPSTRISYQLEQADHVVLAVYNILGQKVQTLVDGFQGAGVQSVVWNGRNADGSTASSGLYFYRLESQNVVQTQKMLLTK